MKSQKFREINRGFTLIELLVVISIIGLLSVISIVTYGDYKKKARNQQRMHEVDLLMKALEMYHLDHNEWPHRGAAVFNFCCLGYSTTQRCMGSVVIWRGCDNFTNQALLPYLNGEVLKGPKYTGGAS